MENRRIKVLLIEDNYDHAYLVRKMLERADSPGYYLKWADRLFKGIEEFSRQDFDILLLDLTLPDSYGLDSLRKINDLFMGSMPIVVMSALDDEETARKAVQEGAQDYLIKGQANKTLLSRSLRYAIERHKMRRDMLRLRREWENIFHSTGNPTVIIDLEKNITMANREAANLINKPLKEILGRKCYQLYHGAEQPIDDCPMNRCLDSKRCELKEVYVEALDKTYLINCTPVQNEHGEIEKIIHAATDITDLKNAEKALRIEKDNIARILESMQDGVYIVNRQYDIEYINLQIEKEFGPTEGKKCYQYLHDRLEVCPWCKNRKVFQGKTVQWEWHSHKTGKTYDLIDTPLNNPDGTVSKLEIFHDITERKRVEERLRYEAIHDSLTGIYNRRHLMGHLVAAVNSANRHRYPFSVCLCDLDDLKAINDTHGHQAGDEVLVAFGRVMEEELRREDVWGRYGGDEFCLVFPHISALDASVSAERVRRRFEKLSFEGDHGESFSTSVTLGIVDLLVKGGNEKELLKAADTALYKGKKLGGNCIIVNDDKVITLNS